MSPWLPRTSGLGYFSCFNTFLVYFPFLTVKTIDMNNTPVLFGIKGFNLLSVGNPCDQMTRCIEFVTVFGSASGRICLEYLDLYLMEFVQIKRKVRGKSSSFWWCKRYSAIWSDSREHSENGFRQNSSTLSRQPRLTAKTFFECFSRIRPDRRIALTPPERAWFSAYSALYLNKFHLVWIEIF